MPIMLFWKHDQLFCFVKQWGHEKYLEQEGIRIETRRVQLRVIMLLASINQDVLDKKKEEAI